MQSSHNRRWKPIQPLVLGVFLIFILIVVAVLSGRTTDVSAAGRPTLAAPPTTTVRNVTLLTANDDALTFTVTVPPLQQSAAMATGTRGTVATSQLLVDGYVNTGLTGMPDLPQRSFWIAVPPGAVPTLSVVSAETITLDNIIAQPATTFDVTDYDATQADSVPTIVETTTFDRTAYAASELWPAEPVVLGEVIRLRDYQLASVTINPVQVNNAAQQAQFHPELTISIQFDYPDGKRPTTAIRAESDVFQDILHNQVVNFADAGNWRDLYRATETTPPASPCMATSTLRANAYRVTLEKTGMTVIRGSDLSAQPAISALRMCYEDHEIAIKVDDIDGDTVFDADDRVIFYGEAIKTDDTNTNAYWLTYGSGSGTRMTSADGTPTSAAIVNTYTHPVTIERDILYYSNYPIEDPLDTYDHWFDGPLVNGKYVPLSYDVADGCATCTLSKSFTLNDIVTGSTVHIEAELWGFRSDEAHRYQVEINGTMVGSIKTFTGTAEDASDINLFSADFASSLLNNGQNTVTIRVLDNQSGANNGLHSMLLNWVRLDVQRQLADDGDHLVFTQPGSGKKRYQATGFSSAPLVFDVTDAVNPIIITGAVNGEFERTNATTARFALSTLTALHDTTNSVLLVEKDTASNLRATTNSADMVIITDASLRTALNPLVNRRIAEGLDVEVVYVRDIFDEFGYGRYSTQAIRDFLQYVYENWGGDREYVLLAGDSTYDHRNLKGLNNGRNLVPVFLHSGIDSYIGEAAADNQFVAFESDGGSPHNLPFFLLGRLPAANSAEMTTMVQKILTYEDAPLAGWQSKHVFPTDNGRVPSACANDPAGDFHATVDAFINNHIGLGQIAQKIYYAPSECYPDPQPYYETNVLVMKNKVISAFQTGAQHIIYTGHSGITNWGHENFFQVADVTALSNTGKLPIMLPMTCLEGQNHRFDLGTTESHGLSEALVKRTNGGAIASFAPTGLQVQTGHDFLIAGYYDAIFENNTTRLGAAVYQAKLNLESATGSSYDDLHDTFTLLGDPSLNLNLWQPTSAVTMPAIMNP